MIVVGVIYTNSASISTRVALVQGLGITIAKQFGLFELKAETESEKEKAEPTPDNEGAKPSA